VKYNGNQTSNLSIMTLGGTIIEALRLMPPQILGPWATL